MKKSRVSQIDRELIARLQRQLDDLRRRLGIGDRGELLFRTDLTLGYDEYLIVEADGFGGAAVRIVEGNYPIDYGIRDERIYATEEEAEEAALEMQLELEG
jgi:hypothetical protein